MNIIKIWDVTCPALYFALAYYAFTRRDIFTASLALSYGIFRIFYSVYPPGYRFKKDKIEPPNDAA